MSLFRPPFCYIYWEKICNKIVKQRRIFCNNSLILLISEMSLSCFSVVQVRVTATKRFHYLTTPRGGVCILETMGGCCLIFDPNTWIIFLKNK